MGLGLNGTETQENGDSLGLGHKITGTQWDWDARLFFKVEFRFQHSYYAMYLIKTGCD